MGTRDAMEGCEGYALMARRRISVRVVVVCLAVVGCLALAYCYRRIRIANTSEDIARFDRCIDEKRCHEAMVLYIRIKWLLDTEDEDMGGFYYDLLMETVAGFGREEWCTILLDRKIRLTLKHALVRQIHDSFTPGPNDDLSDFPPTSAYTGDEDYRDLLAKGSIHEALLCYLRDEEAGKDLQYNSLLRVVARDGEKEWPAILEDRGIPLTLKQDLVDEIVRGLP